MGTALYRRKAFPSELVAGAQPPFAGDQLERTIPTGRLSNHDRLQQSRLFDRGNELLERRGIYRSAGLEWVRPNIFDGQLDQTPFPLGFLPTRPEQRLEPSAKAASSSGGLRHAVTPRRGSMGGRAWRGRAAYP